MITQLAGWSRTASLTCPAVLLAVAWGVSASMARLSAGNLSQLPDSVVALGAVSWEDTCVYKHLQAPPLARDCGHLIGQSGHRATPSGHEGRALFLQLPQEEELRNSGL